MWCERVEGGDREKQVGEQPMTYQLQRVAPHRLQSFSQEAVDVVDSDVERLKNQLELQMYIHEPAKWTQANVSRRRSRTFWLKRRNRTSQ